MKNLQGTETEKNLLKAFAGESQARNRYTYYADIAKKEGYVQISNIFQQTADHERIHAKRFFKFLEGGNLEIKVSYPAGKIGTTLENLCESASGEQHEYEVLYPQFAKTAQKEGFNAIAAAFKMISVAEKFHEKRYRALIKNIEQEEVFQKDHSVRWFCQKCGYIHEGVSAIETCPACLHPQAHFELAPENW